MRYGVAIVTILKKIDHVIMVLYHILLCLFQPRTEVGHAPRHNSSVTVASASSTSTAVTTLWIVSLMQRTKGVVVSFHIPGVGVTKPFSSIALFSKFSSVKTCVSYWISCLYLTGVTTDQLQWHSSNMNVIQKNLTGTLARSKILLTERWGALKSLCKTVLSKCSFILNKGSVNIWIYCKVTCTSDL